jgi:hypothetical protein
MVGLFAVALGTGVLVGMGLREARPHDRNWSWLSEELKLTPDQSERIRAIWSDMLQGPASRPSGERRRAAQKERDESIVALLKPDQKESYDKILEHYNQQTAEITRDREAAFQAAVERTKAVLDDGQRVKYEELLKKGFRGSPMGRGSSTRGAATQSAAPAASAPEGARTTK